MYGCILRQCLRLGTTSVSDSGGNVSSVSSGSASSLIEVRLSRETKRMITSFRGPHRFLSNFYPCKIVLETITYPSVEHAFQAAKTVDRCERVMISKMPTAVQAKRAGRQATLRENWETLRVDIMHDLVTQKFQG